MLENLSVYLTKKNRKKLKNGFDIWFLGSMGGLWEDEEFYNENNENEDWLFFKNSYLDGIGGLDDFFPTYNQYFELVEKHINGVNVLEISNNDFCNNIKMME